MTKVVIAVLIALFAAYAYAQSGGGAAGRYQVSAAPGGNAWRIDTQTGSLWYCWANIIPPHCDKMSEPAK